MPNTINQYRLHSGKHNNWLQHTPPAPARSAPHQQDGEQLLQNVSYVASEPIENREIRPLKFKRLAGGIVAGLLVGCAIGSVVTVAVRRSYDAEQPKPFNPPPEASASVAEGNFTVANTGAGNRTREAAAVCPKPENIVATQQIIDSYDIPSMKYCSPSRTNCQWEGYDPFADEASTVTQELNTARQPTLNNGLTYCDYGLASGSEIRMALQKPPQTGG
ncbi:hypothetical protein [Vagococcus sp. WN89Y]|uniref:hypothetical protein n=1 Tax=Vagococcus sp. WN89Y TaxID=3457258 RepID=UPI003FCCBD53